MDQFFAPSPRRGLAHHEFKPLEFYFPSERGPIDPTDSIHIPLLHKDFVTKALSFVSPCDITTLKQKLNNFLCNQSIDVEDHNRWFLCTKLVNEKQITFNIKFYATQDNKYLCIIQPSFECDDSLHQITEELQKALGVSFIHKFNDNDSI